MKTEILIAALAVGGLLAGWLLASGHPLTTVVRRVRKRFPRTLVRRAGKVLRLEEGDACVLVPISSLRAMVGTSDEDPRTYRLLVEIAPALTRRPLADAELGRLIPVPMASERTERGDECARFTVGLHEEFEIAFALESVHSGRWMTVCDVEDRSVATKELLHLALEGLHQQSDGATVYREGRLGSELCFGPRARRAGRLAAVARSAMEETLCGNKGPSRHCCAEPRPSLRCTGGPTSITGALDGAGAGGLEHAAPPDQHSSMGLAQSTPRTLAPPRLTFHVKLCE